MIDQNMIAQFEHDRQQLVDAFEQLAHELASADTNDLEAYFDTFTSVSNRLRSLAAYVDGDLTYAKRWLGLDI